MDHSLEEGIKPFLDESSKIVSIPTKPKPSNITVITDITDNKISRSIYISKKIIDDFSVYAKGSREGMAYHLEHALLEYMINHPHKNQLVTIQHVLKESINNEVQRELDDQLLCSDIKEYLEVLEKITKNGRGNLNEFKYGLRKVVSTAIKFRDPSDKLLSLLRQVKDSGYFE